MIAIGSFLPLLDITSSSGENGPNLSFLDRTFIMFNINHLQQLHHLGDGSHVHHEPRSLWSSCTLCSSMFSEFNSLMFLSMVFEWKFSCMHKCNSTGHSVLSKVKFISL